MIIQTLLYLFLNIAQMFSYEQKKILSLISGCLTHTVFGAIYTLGTITPYIASFIFYTTNPNIRVVDVSINYPVLMISQTIGIILSMFCFQFIINRKLLSFLSVWGFSASVFVASYMNQLWSYTLIYSGCLGFFMGIGYMQPFKNTYSYFPQRKGMCAGICMMGYGIGSFVYNQIFLHIVNPNNEAANENHIFPQDIAKNFPFALRIMGLTYFCLGNIGSILFITKQTKNDQMIDSENGYSQPSIISTSKQNQSLIKYVKYEGSISMIKVYFQENPQKKIQLFKIWITVFTSAVYGVFIAYNYKQYGETIYNNDNLITFAGSLGCFFNTLGRIVWCFSFDYLSFKSIMTILNCSLLLCCITCVFVHNEYVFIIIVVLTYFFCGAFYGIMPTQTVRTFGDVIGTILYPFAFVGFFFASITQFSIHQFVISKWGNSGFTAAFVGFGTAQIISIILVRTLKFQKLDKRQYAPDAQDQKNRQL